MISATENSNKFQKKSRFRREKEVEDVVTLGPTAEATLEGGEGEGDFTENSVNEKGP